MDSAIIFGTGRLGVIAFHVLEKKYKIIFFCDNDPKKQGGQLLEKTVIEPGELGGIEPCKIIIASMYYDDISVQLLSMGIDRNKIFVFHYQDMNDITYTRRYTLSRVNNIENYKKLSVKSNTDNEFLKKWSQGENKRLLLIAYLFPPVGGSGVQRPLKFVKHLASWGWEITVLTCGQSFSTSPDDCTLLAEIPESVKVIRIEHEDVHTEGYDYQKIQAVFDMLCGVINDRKISEAFLEEIKRGSCSYRRTLVCPDKEVLWVFSVLSKIENILDISLFDVIYSTSNPYSAHIINYYLKRKYQKPMLVEFRDEWSNNNYRKKDQESVIFKTEHRMEESILKMADKIIVVTPSAKDNYIKLFSVHPEKIEVITNGYDENDFAGIATENARNKKFTITANGSFYAIRNPYSVIQAVNELIEVGSIDKDKIEMQFVGNSELGIIDKATQLDKNNIIINMPYMSHWNSLLNASKADMLLLVVGLEKSVKATYPGKVFEYLRLKKSILALSPKDSDIEKLLQVTQSGVSYEYSNIQGIKDYILKQYNRWLNDEVYPVGVNSEIEKYERRYIAKGLEGLILGMIK